MTRIVEGPKYRRATCDSCESVVEYLPEDVKSKRVCNMGELETIEHVECPRDLCKGICKTRCT